MVLRPDIPGSTVATPGPLPASSDAPVTGGPVSAPITTGSPAPTPPPHDGAGAASDLHATEARREDTPTTSARDVYRARIDRLRERIRDLPTLPDARASTTLTEVLAEARSLETSGDTNFVVDDLIAVRGCYRYLSRRAAESTFLRGHPEYASIATGLTRVEGTMRAARDIFRGAATGATGNCTPRERMHMSRLAIRLSRDLLETTFESSDLNHEASELITDYRNEMHLLRGVGSEDLPDRDRADRIARDLSETFDLRTRLRTDTHIVRIEDHDIALVTNAAEQNLQAVDSLMLGFGTDLHNSVGFIESRNAHAAIDRLIHGIIEGNQESLVPRLNAAGLEEYCRLSAAAEESVERASGLTDPAARRTALAEALQGFVSLGDTSRVGEVVDLMVASLPADASDTLRLQVFTAMGSILHGSGMNAETRIRELADPIARRLAATETPEVYHREIEADEYTGPGGRSGATVVSTTLVNERGYLNTAAAIMAARSYYSAVGDTEAARGSETRLTDLRSQIDSQLNRTSGSRLRIELSASSVEIDMALEGSASAEHLGAWRTAIRSASDLPADERLTQLRSLLRVATLTRREAESGGTERTDLAEINTWATDVIGTIAEDRIRQLTTDHHVDTEFSASVISDFRTRLGRAVTEGDTAWIGGVSERAIDQFADLAQSGHVLLSGRHTPPTTRDLRSCLQAAAIFSRLGSTGRVTEAMAPLLTHAEGIENTTERANFYLSLGQVYQEAGMSVDANQILDRVAALDVTGAPRELHRIAEIVPAMRELNLGHLDRARELLTGIRGNPRAEEMLGNVEGAIRRSRSLQTLDALRILASDYIARERAHGSSRADASDREIRSALDEAQRLIVSGRFTTVEAALSHLHGESFGLSDMIRDSAGTGPIDGLFRASADVTMSSDRFSENMLAFASGLADGEYYSAASQIGNLLTRNPHTSAAARTLVDGIPGAARLSGILTEIGNMSIIFAESDSAALRSGVITIATFGLGRVAAAGAELAFASYATESAIASSMALRATGFVVRSTAEATTFTLSNMAFETLFTGRTDHWSLDNFGHQFGAMMVTFMFCHGIGMATTGLGRAAARTSLLGEVAADGSRTLSLTGRVAMGAVGYGATITGLTGVEYINEGLGLHPPGGNVPFLTRLLGSAVMDAQMRLAGRVFNEATGGAVERWEAGTRERYAIHELLPAIERLGFGRPNAEGELSGEGTTVLRAMLARVARGESASEVAASVSAETSGDLTRITQTVLGVEPNSADGRRLQALLFAYRAAHPDANLAEVAGRLQIESNRLARAAGLTEGPEYEIVRAELFRRSLASSSTVEAVTGNSAAFAELRPGLEGVANDLLGSGGSSSLEGQRLIGRLLLRSLDSSGGLRVERAATERIREQVRGMGLDPDSSAGRRMSADLLLAHLDRSSGGSERLTLAPNTEAGDSRLDGDVLHVDFRNPGFRHLSIAGHGEVWFGETATTAGIRIDNHTGASLTVIRTRPLPEGSPYQATETLAPEGPSTPPGSTILQPGDRVRFADGREIVIGGPLRATRRVASPAPETASVPTPEASARSEEATVPGRRVRRPGGEAPVIPLASRETRAAVESGEPDLLAAFRHADPAAPPSRELLRRAFALSDRLARQFGLTDPHDASVSRPFREAMARRAAEGPITESGLREMAASFRTLDASLNGVDPLMRTEVRRRVFARMLSGEISPARARELSRLIRSGEVRIETASEGGLNTVTVPTEAREAARTTAERRIFDHLAETHFPETVADQLREGHRDGSITLERLETAVNSLTAIRRFISDSGTEPSSPRGHEILNRVALDLARGRMEVREGRIVRVSTEAAPVSGEPESPTVVDPAPPATGEVTAVGTPRRRPAAAAVVAPTPPTDSLPASFSVDSRSYTVESAEVAGDGTLATGETLINLEDPPAGRTPVFRALLADTRAFAERSRIPEPRRFIYTADDRVAVEFTSGGARRRVFLRNPDEGRIVDSSGAGASELRDGILNVDFSDPSSPFRSIPIPGLRGRLRFALGAGENIQLINFSGEPFTVLRAEATEDHPASELVRPETATRHPGRTEVRPGDRIRFADGREIVLRFDLPASETAAAPAGPPPDLPPGGGGDTVVGRRRPPPPAETADSGSTVVGRRRPPPEPAPAEPSVEGAGAAATILPPPPTAIPPAVPLEAPAPLVFAAGPGGIHQAETAGAQITLEANGMVSVGHPEHEVRVEYRGETHTVPADEALVLGNFREGDIVGINGRYFVRSHHGLREVASPPTIDDIAQRFNRGERIPSTTGGRFSSVFDLGDGRMAKVAETTGERRDLLDNEQSILASIHFNIAEHPETYGALADFVPGLLGRPDPAILLLSRVPGRTLESVAEGNPAALREIPTEAWDQFRRNLELLNRMGISHSDMSLSNIMWDGHTLRLIDFGHSRFVEAIPGASESWDINALYREMGPRDPRFSRTSSRDSIPLASEFDRSVAAPEIGFHPETSAAIPEPPPALPVAPASEASVAPVIPLRRSAPVIAEPERIAAFASDVFVDGDTAMIGEEIFQVETGPAAPVFGELPPVARTLFRFRNRTMRGESDTTPPPRDLTIALPGEHSLEEVARMISRLSPSVRRQLSIHAPEVVGRIVEMSERMRSHPVESTVEGFFLSPTLGGDTVGAGIGSQVFCTGEIVGVGGGRTAFRGYIVGTDGARRPVAIIRVTHSGESIEAEARTLNWMMEAGAGEVRIEGRISLEGGTAIVSNLAEGEIHGSGNPLPPRERPEYNRLLSRDAARLATRGFATGGFDRDFQAVWGRDRSGRARLQWIDTVGLIHPIDGERSADLSRRSGHETLTAQDWYLENLSGFGLYNSGTGHFAEGVPHTFQEALREESGRRERRSSSIPPPPP